MALLYRFPLVRLALALLVTHAPLAAACPTNVPGGLQSEPVGEEIVANGLPMRIRQVTSKEAVSDILDRAEQQWKDDRYVVTRQHVGNWDVVSARSGECNTTLQLMDRNGATVGYFGVADPKRQADWLPKKLKIKLPGNIELGSTVASNDSGRSGMTIAFSTKRSVMDINDYFMHALQDAGWTALRSHELRKSPTELARVVSAQREHDQVSIVLWDDGRTRAIVNISEAL